MATGSGARWQGDQYQARLFWFHAARLFIPEEHVLSVGYELDKPTGFDDVVVIHDTGVPDGRGGMFHADYYQSKFHVDQRGDVAAEHLTDPKYINSQKSSLLQNLQRAQQHVRARGQEGRFNLVTPWQLRAGDPLRELIDLKAGSVRLDLLADASKITRVRANLLDKWQEHLGCSSRDELLSVLASLRLESGWHTLDDFRSRLNDRLIAAGIRPGNVTQLTFIYDDLIVKLFESGQSTFTADNLKTYLKQEGLWIGRAVEIGEKRVIAIRSFAKGTQSIADRAESLLDLTSEFHGRQVFEEKNWNSSILPKIENYLDEISALGGDLEINLDVHTSIAFAVGRALDQSRTKTVPVQFDYMGRGQPWDPTCSTAEESSSQWEVETIRIGDENRTQVALAVSVAREVVNDVRAFLESTASEVGEIIHYRVAGGVSRQSVRDPAHAWQLASILADEMLAVRKNLAPQEPFHIFIAAPVAFTFFLGKQSKPLGHCQLYEYNFETSVLGAYSPSIVLSGKPTYPPLMPTETSYE